MKSEVLKIEQKVNGIQRHVVESSGSVKKQVSKIEQKFDNVQRNVAHNSSAVEALTTMMHTFQGSFTGFMNNFNTPSSIPVDPPSPKRPVDPPTKIPKHPSNGGSSAPSVSSIPHHPSSPGGSDPSDGKGTYGGSGGGDPNPHGNRTGPMNPAWHNYLGNQPISFPVLKQKSVGKSFAAKTATGLQQLFKNCDLFKAWCSGTHVMDVEGCLSSEDLVDMANERGAQLAFEYFEDDQIPSMDDETLTCPPGLSVHPATWIWLKRYPQVISAEIPDWIKSAVEYENHWTNLDGFQTLIAIFFAHYKKMGINTPTKDDALNDAVSFGPVSGFEPNGDPTFEAMAAWWKLVEDRKVHANRSGKSQRVNGGVLNLTKISQGLLKAMKAYQKQAGTLDKHQIKVIDVFEPLEKFDVTWHDIKVAYNTLRSAWMRVPQHQRTNVPIAHLASGPAGPAPPAPAPYVPPAPKKYGDANGKGGKGKGKGKGFCPQVKDAKEKRCCREWYVLGKCSSKDQCGFEHLAVHKGKAKDCPYESTCTSAVCWHKHPSRANPFAFFNPN